MEEQSFVNIKNIINSETDLKNVRDIAITCLIKLSENIEERSEDIQDMITELDFIFK
jgi:hypothetical protein